MSFREKEGQFVTSVLQNLFYCPHCNSDFETKEYFLLHLKEQHTEDAKHLDESAIDKLEKYKTGESNTLNL